MLQDVFQQIETLGMSQAVLFTSLLIVLCFFFVVYVISRTVVAKCNLMSAQIDGMLCDSSDFLDKLIELRAERRVLLRKLALQFADSHEELIDEWADEDRLREREMWLAVNAVAIEGGDKKLLSVAQAVQPVGALRALAADGRQPTSHDTKSKKD